MSTQTAERLAMINHICPGDRVVLSGVDWEDYEDLINHLGDDSHLRISYSGGILEVLSPSTPHEKYKTLIDVLVHAIGYELEIDVIGFGSFTMKVDRLRKGAEADDCFYIQHASLMIDRDHLQLGVDPPPDLVVEIDLTRDSRRKFDIYASFGVPEIWRYDGLALSVFQLIDSQYAHTEFSACFPFLSSAKLTELLDGVSSGTHRAWKALREWLRANKPSDSSAP
ncbi:MAG TPA: Uma2 family endonuclease [Blastocatellia bacterium]